MKIRSGWKYRNKWCHFCDKQIGIDGYFHNECFDDFFKNN